MVGLTHGLGTSWGLVWDHTSDSSPDDEGWESSVEWTLLRVGESSLSSEVFEFQFIPK